MKLQKIVAYVFLSMLTCAHGATTPEPSTPIKQAPEELPPVSPKKIADAPPQEQPQEQPDSITPPVIQTKIVSGKTEVPLCASLPLTGETAIIGKNIADGMNLFFNKQRQDKQNSNILTQLNAKDNQSILSIMLNTVTDLQKKSPLFLSLTGTNVITTLLPKLDAGEIMSLFPIEGTTIYRTQEHKNLIFFRPPHEAELEALIHYATKALNKYKIALLYESSEWGEDCRTSLKKIITKYKATLVAESFYPEDTLNVTNAANQIAASAPNVICCVAQARAAYNFIQQIINKGLPKTVFLCLSTLMPIQQPLLTSRGINIITASVVPDPVKSNLPIAQEFRKDLSRFLSNQKPSAFLFEGYINAALTSEILKLVHPPFTIEGVRAAIENIGKVNFKGLSLSFDPNTRTLSHTVWINNGQASEWFLSQTSIKAKKQ